MALDLSALEDDAPASAAESNGKPLEIALDMIDEDPNQPRTEFSEESMQEMTASIKARGVKSPVSVRPNPSAPGRWFLNYGARRYRGSRLAGKLTIPAFVDEAHDNYDQVIENLQREDLKPMELALFIQKRLALGEKKGEIAKRLGKDSSIVTNHLALIEAPACIEDAYTSGKCASAKTLYELRSLHDKYPEQVDAWCAAADVIDRRTVTALGDELKGKKKPATSPAEPATNTDPVAASASADAALTSNGDSGGPARPITVEDVPELFLLNPAPAVASSGATVDGDGQGETGGGAGDMSGAGSTVTTVPFHNPDNEKEPKDLKLPDPDKLKKPLLLVEHNGRAAMLLLFRRPTSAGLVHIRYEDGSGEEEVDAGLVKINLLTESTQ